MTSRGVAGALARRLGAPFWRGLRWRIDVIAMERADAAAAQVREELAEVRREFGTARRNLRRDLDEVRHQVDRIGRQLAALEERTAGLERPSAELNGGELPAEARDLLDEVRAEHAKVRARVTAAAIYEERIGRLEQQVFPGERAEGAEQAR